jgi:hypothetical protein
MVNTTWRYEISTGALTGIARIFEGDRKVGDLTVSWPGKLGSTEQQAAMESLDRDAQRIVDTINDATIE